MRLKLLQQNKLIQYCSIDGHDSEHISSWDLSRVITRTNPFPGLSSELEHSETDLFAVDTNLTCTAKLISEAKKVNDDLLVLGIWLSANKLSANLVKTEYMILATSSKLKALDFSPLIKLNGNSIKRVSKTDYPGLIIDKNLSWKRYIDSLKLKISSALMVMKQVSFLPRESLTTLCHSLVES